MFKEKTNRALTFHLVVALLFTLSLGKESFGQEGTSASLPPGNWAVRCSAFRTAGYEALPVLVTGVTSQIDGGIEVTSVNIKNRTAQNLTVVRLSWYLSTQEDPASVLQQGRTKLLNLRRAGGIDAGETREVLFPVVSFAAIHRPLLQRGELNGKYLIQIAVSEARFDDGSSQTLLTSNGRLTRAVTFAKASYPSARVAQTFCPNQTCEVVRDATTNRPLGYTCISSTGEVCSNNINARSCNSALCSETGGGRPPVLP